MPTAKTTKAVSKKNVATHEIEDHIEDTHEEVPKIGKKTVDIHDHVVGLEDRVADIEDTLEESLEDESEEDGLDMFGDTWDE